MRQPGTSVDSAERRTLDIFVISLAVLLIEISFTRVISFKLFYYYTYLAIGLALLGIGSGGVLVATSKRLRAQSTEAIIRWGSALGAIGTIVSYLIVAQTNIATVTLWNYSRDSAVNMVKLLWISFALSIPFVIAGVLISVILGRGASRVGRLYFYDLLGAGTACLFVVWLLEHLGPPATIALAGTMLALLCVRNSVAEHVPRTAVLGLLIAGPLAAIAIWPTLVPDVEVDDIKQLEGDTVFSAWNPIFRVDAQELPDRLLLYHDGLLGSAIYRYDGDPASLARFDEDLRAFPFAVAGEQADVLIIGAAGGNEVLAALRFDAAQIDAVELNPVTHRMVTDTFADFAGHIADLPNVDYIQGDGRTFVARSDDTYDVVWFPAPDSYSAQNAATAGAFVLSESYLYTEEMMVDALEHLTEDGVLAAQFGEVDFDLKPNRTSRYLSTARAALASIGVDDPSAHIALLTVPNDLGASRVSTILVKRTPFSPEEVERLADRAALVPEARVEHLPGGESRPGVATDIITLGDDDLDAFLADYRYDVSSITDDGPFFWSFARLGDVITDFGEPLRSVDLEDSAGERVIILLLVVSVLFALLFLLVPFVMVRDTWKALPNKGRSGLYFAALGLGFILFEIALIQRLVLFLGYPTYSLTVTLASLLIFTGVGALLSERLPVDPRRTVPILATAVVGLTGVYLFVLPSIIDALLDTSLLVRVVVTFVLLAPLGLCLGTFMPQGLRAVSAMSSHTETYVAWGWAVNGFASVTGSVLTTLLAMTFGFSVVFVVAMLIYLFALLVLRTMLGGATGLAPGTEIVLDESDADPARDPLPV
ncbi:MAG TPA: hypothetical protein VMW08_06660 [Acidimicrobiales bacterium]|nr:hypothetical protein [Acidimicrobiales bacterium]